MTGWWERCVPVSLQYVLDYQKALVIAMRREKASYKFYSDLAQTVSDPALKDTFIALSQEEAKHKLRLETIYEKEVLLWD